MNDDALTSVPRPGVPEFHPTFFTIELGRYVDGSAAVFQPPGVEASRLKRSGTELQSGLVRFAGHVATLMINAHRTKEAATELLGGMGEGVLCMDRYAACGRSDEWIDL